MRIFVAISHRKDRRPSPNGQAASPPAGSKARLLHDKPLGVSVWKRVKLAMLVGCTGPLGLLWGARHVAKTGQGWIVSDTCQLTGDLAIILGAGLKQDGTPSDMLEDRLHQGLEIWRAGRAERILVSGFPPHSNVMLDWMRARGVPDAALIHDPNGQRTVRSMLFARNECGSTKPIICTQAFHLPRALWLARSMGMRAVGFPVDRRIYGSIRRARRREVFGQVRAFIDAHRLEMTPRNLHQP